MSMMHGLPIEKHRRVIEEAVRDNQVTVLVGETGSGKTTRVPLYLYEAGLAKQGRIGVTQPRRIAAISVAEYVAAGMGCRVGEEVGFQIRFNDATTEGTKIKFMTDGILLQEAKSDPLFSRYDVLVFDEAHERGLNTDFCLGLAKRALAQRPELKVVVMSATIDAEKFAAFFNNAPIVRIEGRMFPVEVRYLDRADVMEAKNLLNLKRGQETEAYAAYRVDRIHRSASPGDILVFMPGEAEIHRTIRMIEDFGHSGLTVFPVFGNMNPDDQRRIFSRTRGRKVVVATNIAETSITVDGVVHVVDSGLIRETDFDPKSGIGSLKVVEHSKAGLEQRKGRAGRTQPGVCWRLFSEEEFEKGRYEYRRNWGKEERPEFTKPEIQRSDLAGVVLRLIGIGIKDVENFELPDAPSREMIVNAVLTLQAIGALTPSFDITPLGEKLLDLPVEPRIGRMIIAAEEFGCVEEVIAIAAKLSVRDLHMRPKGKEFEADAAKQKFQDQRSDLLTALTVVRVYEENRRDRRWASENFLNWKAIEELINIREQLRNILEGLGVKITSVAYRLPKDQFDLKEEEKKQGEAVGKAVTAGLIQNFAVSAGYRHSYRRTNGLVHIHPSSSVFNPEPGFIVSDSVTTTSGPKGDKTWARDCQEVKAQWLQEIAPHAVQVEMTGPRRRLFSFSSESDDYLVTKIIRFNGIVISEEELPAEGPEVTGQIVKDIMSGDFNIGCEFANRETLRRVEQIHIASEGKTKKALTREELKEFYIARLEGVTSVAEARAKNLLINIRDFVSEQEEEEYGPKVDRVRHHLIEPSTPRTDMFEEAPFSKEPEQDLEIDLETQGRISAASNRVATIIYDPDRYGYKKGGVGLSLALEFLKGVFRRGNKEEAQWLLLALEEEIRTAFKRVEEFEARREKKALEVAAKKEKKEAEAADRRRIEEAWREYERVLPEFRERHKDYPGWGIYTFSVSGGMPQDFRGDDGKTYSFDQDFFEVLPKEGSVSFTCWGYVTQWGAKTRIAAILEVVLKPKHLGEEEKTRK